MMPPSKIKNSEKIRNNMLLTYHKLYVHQIYDATILRKNIFKYVLQQIYLHYYIAKILKSNKKGKICN